MSLDYRTMDKEYVERLPEERKQIYVIQGNLDDERLRQLPKINGVILVTGNVFFVQDNTVHCGLIVLGDAEMRRATVKGSMAVYGKCKAKRLTVHGDLGIKAEGSEIDELRLTGKLTHL